MKRFKICVPGISERKDREIGAEAIFKEMMSDSFPKLTKDIMLQIQDPKAV